jgi:RNA polymerase sigma-70 factor (ECF subfamily)
VDSHRLDQLLPAAQRLEPAALTELVEGYQGRVYGLLYRLTRSREAAEDLTQETFLRVVRTIGGYQHDGRFEAWLFRIAANLARDQARRGKRRGATTSLDTPDDSGDRIDLAGQREAPPEAALQGLETDERVNAALAELSDADREVLLLRHFSELSFREIADLLGIPLGTALARAHRALKRLRDRLGPEIET